MSQDESKQPREYSTFCNAMASDERGVSFDSVMVWCLGRFQHNCRATFEQRRQVLFRDVEVAVE